MKKLPTPAIPSFLTATALAACLSFSGGAPVRAADHADSPITANDPAADLNDSYIFLDPNDNTQVIIALTVRGFIVPGEAVNQGIFDPSVVYRFWIENTGDAKADLKIDVLFNARKATDKAQIATVVLPNRIFTARATNPSLASTSPEPNIVTSGNTAFFAGEVDDPFFFDIPAFSRFVASVRAGSPDASLLTRGRDSFAGYNTMAIALRMPVSVLKGSSPFIGLNVVTIRQEQHINADGGLITTGNPYRVDRAATPAVNVALIPFAKKNAFNASGPIEDAQGKFAGDIVATLQALGTDQAHINVLAGIAVANGDYLHMDTRIANTGQKGGTNPAASFPNGRRLTDDTIDIILTQIANGTPLGDNVNASDVSPRNRFPFFGPSQQPLNTGVLDDNTRN